VYALSWKPSPLRPGGGFWLEEDQGVPRSGDL